MKFNINLIKHEDKADCIFCNLKNDNIISKFFNFFNNDNMKKGLFFFLK